MARSLVQSKFRKVLREAAGEAAKADTLEAGHMRLYSFYRPSLQAANYGIEAKQTITANGESLTKFNSQVVPVNGNDQLPILQQEFEVIAPQFSLDPKLINSFYPPTGHSDEGRILPHIVFNDPHVPWFRAAGLASWMTDAVDTNTTNLLPDHDNGRNFVPWLALMVFKPDELQVGIDEAKALGLTDLPLSSYDPTKLPGNGAFPVTVGQYLTTVKSRVLYDDDEDVGTLRTSTDPMKVIFPTKGQVLAALGGLDPTTPLDKVPGILKGGNAQTAPNILPLQNLRYLTHVRRMNTIGFPGAGVEEEGYFSVVVSSMTGDMSEVAPTTHVVHLVSIEHMDATLTDPIRSTFFNTDNSSRIGLVSLFSWTYSCVPESASFKDTMHDLAELRQPLRPPQQALNTLDGKGSSEKGSKKLYERLEAGYTMARWRLPTGEQTIAFNRGPLVPMATQPSPGSRIKADMHWPSLSMTGKDYAIFDKDVGVMDVTYSAAWSMGKLMAISDSVFNAALMRFRSLVWQIATSITNMASTGMGSRAAQLEKALDAMHGAKAIEGGKLAGLVSRINKPSSDQPVPLPFNDSKIKPILHDAIARTVDHLASKDATTDPGLFNGFDGQPGTNSDWDVILNWVHDVMYLASIPAHVLFPEPLHLRSLNPTPPRPGQSQYGTEALRFFHIDDGWIDAFLDGALSCANHLEPEFDSTRLRIKAIVNEFLTTPVGTTGITPPVPRYGFILRSVAVKSIPDLRLTVTSWTYDATKKKWSLRDPLVRNSKMDDFTILALVDCAPEELCQITYAQPPHQQRFALDFDINPATDYGTNGLVQSVHPSLELKKLYTQGPAPIEWDTKPPLQQIPKTDQEAFYKMASRCIQADVIAKKANDNLNAWGHLAAPPTYVDPVPNSCIVGLELNDPSYRLVIDGPFPDPKKPPKIPFDPQSRKLWLGDAQPSDFIPSAFRPGPENLKTADKLQPSAPSVVPPKDIILTPHDPSLNVAPPPKILLNSHRPVPRPNVIPKTLPPGDSIRDPFTNSPGRQFELLVHPDYRPPPPRPIHNEQGRLADDVYSPLDWLPTKTNGLYDLIFAVRRRAIVDTNLKLKSLTIEIPLSDGNNKPDPRAAIREPLMADTTDCGTGIRMCSNQRFVPTLYHGKASTIGAKTWDGLAILGIMLVPRSGLASGTMQLKKDDKAREVGVRLTQPTVMECQDKSLSAQVKVAAWDPVTKRPSNPLQHRGRCLIRMTEHYGDEKTDRFEWSWCVALKQDLGDNDPYTGQLI